MISLILKSLSCRSRLIGSTSRLSSRHRVRSLLPDMFMPECEVRLSQPDQSIVLEEPKIHESHPPFVPLRTDSNEFATADDLVIESVNAVDSMTTSNLSLQSKKSFDARLACVCRVRPEVAGIICEQSHDRIDVVGIDPAVVLFDSGQRYHASFP